MSKEAMTGSDSTVGKPGYGRTREDVGAEGAQPKEDPWWKIRIFSGIANDLRRRAPYYGSDWKDAWDYRVVPATVYMYFANILPALAFSLDMFNSTASNYGVNEVLLASVLGSFVFSVFAAQPLVIVGVTGPITVFNYTVFDIITPSGVNYMPFMCWIGIWSLIFHWILAVTNSCNLLKYVTRFPCDIFGFYVAFIYLQKGVEVLARLPNDGAFYLSVVCALLVFMFAYFAGVLGTSSLFTHHVRVFLKDYGTPITLVFFTGFAYMGRMKEVDDLETLPIGIAFQPTIRDRWIMDPRDVSVGEAFIAAPFAVLLTILFWFDHNVSSLIAQGTEFPLKKPAGFHWDLFLLGLTTGVAGILGLPFPNGLIPQAPFHTESLCVTKAVKVVDEKGEHKGGYTFEATHVVEQRFSNLAQGLLTLGTMTGPLLVCLHLIPHGVLAGLFFVMGIQALEANGITAKLVFLGRDKGLTPPDHPLLKVRRRKAIWWFVGIEILGFAATFAITQTIAAVGFPVFIMALIPIRIKLLPKIFTPEELDALDEATASPFTMESCGGIHGQDPYDSSSAGNSGGASGGNGRGGADSGDETDVGHHTPPGGEERGARCEGVEQRRRPSMTHLKSADHHTSHEDGVFAYPGSNRKSQESLAEIGKVHSGGEMATPSRRRHPSTLPHEMTERHGMGRNPTTGSDRHDFAGPSSTPGSH